jgi:hypothetical protein
VAWLIGEGETLAIVNVICNTVQVVALAYISGVIGARDRRRRDGER